MGAVTSSIAAKFAFFPPTPPSYDVIKDDHGQWRFRGFPVKENVEVTMLNTRKKQTIAALFVRHRKANLTVLYSHGNAADLGQMHDLFLELSNMLEVNVFGYDYTGYGASTGKASEANTYADIEAAFEYLLEVKGVPENEIILYGQSVGSGPTVDLAARRKHIRGVILHSPILSGVRVLYPTVKTTYWFDIYKNIDKIGAISCPVLVMHGRLDEVVDWSHGERLASLAKNSFEPLWVTGGHHCDLEFFPEYLVHLRRFMAALRR